MDSYDEIDRKADEAEQEEEYREYCRQNDLDPEDEDNRAHYKEVKDELDNYWDDMDEDDRDGWNDNILKSFD